MLIDEDAKGLCSSNVYAQRDRFGHALSRRSLLRRRAGNKRVHYPEGSEDEPFDKGACRTSGPNTVSAVSWIARGTSFGFVRPWRNKPRNISKSLCPNIWRARKAQNGSQRSERGR